MIGGTWLQRLIKVAAAAELSEKVTFANHAQEMMAERRIETIWVINAVKYPEFTSVDPRNPARTRAFRRVPEAGNRWLRVVYEHVDGKKHVITTFFDRKAGQER